MSTARLERTEYTKEGTFGRLIVGDKEWLTVERPWLANQSMVSCIPTGVYTLKKRASGVVSRSTGGKYKEGWEVTKVKDRTFIMIHPGNTMNDLQGCIAPGKKRGVVNGVKGVLNSRQAFDELMSTLAGQDVWTLTVIDKLKPGS